MKKHTKVYLESVNKTVADVIMCELCHQVAVDIHHIKGRLGEDANKPENLIALCRQCHEQVHDGKIERETLLKVAKRRINANNRN